MFFSFQILAPAETPKPEGARHKALERYIFNQEKFQRFTKEWLNNLSKNPEPIPEKKTNSVFFLQPSL